MALAIDDRMDEVMEERVKLLEETVDGLKSELVAERINVATLAERVRHIRKVEEYAPLALIFLLTGLLFLALVARS